MGRDESGDLRPVILGLSCCFCLNLCLVSKILLVFFWYPHFLGFWIPPSYSWCFERFISYPIDIRCPKLLSNSASDGKLNSGLDWSLIREFHEPKETTGVFYKCWCIVDSYMVCVLCLRSERGKGNSLCYIVKPSCKRWQQKK